MEKNRNKMKSLRMKIKFQNKLMPLQSKSKAVNKTTISRTLKEMLPREMEKEIQKMNK